MAGSLTWLGDGDPAATEITQYGVVFPKGEAVEVKDKKLFARFAGHPLFEASEPDDDDDDVEGEIDEEVKELRADLDALDVKYSKRAKAPALRAKLEEATK